MDRAYYLLSLFMIELMKTDVTVNDRLVHRSREINELFYLKVAYNFFSYKQVSHTSTLTNLNCIKMFERRGQKMAKQAILIGRKLT